MDQTRITPLSTGVNQTSQSAGGGRQVGHITEYGEKRAATALREGDVVKGEITDLRNNQITVTLEDNTHIRAMIKDTSNLAIGEYGAFRIKEISPKAIVVEAEMNPAYQTSKVIINKALTEAGMPKTEETVKLVQALLENNLSINKESLLSMQRSCYRFPGADPSSLALLTRMHMPLTETNVMQMDAYLHGNHQIISQVNNLSEQLPSLLETLSKDAPAGAVSQFAEQLLSILDGANVTSSSRLDTSIGFLSMEERELLAQTLSSLPMGESMSESILSGTADIATMLEAKAELDYLQKTMPEELSGANALEEADFSDENSTSVEENAADSPAKAFSDTAKKTLANGLSLLQKAAETMLTRESSTADPSSQIFEKLRNQMQQILSSRHMIGGCLTSEECGKLHADLKQMQLPASILSKVSDGTATARELLLAFRQVIPNQNPQTISAFFQSSAFQKLFGDALIQNWSLSPEELAVPGRVNEFYNRMEQQMQQLETLIHRTLSGEDASKITSQASGIQQNMDFMQTLNQVFTYVQFPLHMKEQIQHADLYVYSDKEKLRSHPDNVSMLLHLDMPHLGNTDIHVQLTGHQIDTQFYLPDNATKELITNNTALLRDALAEKGYALTATTHLAERESDIVKDYLDVGKASPAIKRYSFDIRT